MRIQLNNITVMERIRQDNGDLQALMKGIRDHGLMNPITVMENDGHYVLIAGYRRMIAVQALDETEIEATVLSPVDAEEQLCLEIEENENRKEFTDSEKVAYAKKLRVIEAEKARKRMGGHNKPDESKSSQDNCPEMTTGQSRDIVARKVGYGSGKQLERSEYVADHRPDLMQKVDAKEMSVSGAYAKARADERKERMEKLAALGVGMVEHDGGTRTLGHTGAEFNRPDGFPFVLESFKTAARFYLSELQAAIDCYTPIIQNAENSAALSAALRETFKAATDLFGDYYVNEEVSVPVNNVKAS